MYDVLIIGAGVSGCAIARELSRYNLRIALVESQPDVAMGATKANSAIVHGGYAENHKKLKGRLCYQGRRQFDDLNSELNFGFKAIGSLVLAFEESQRQNLTAMLENGKKNGLHDLAILERDELLKLEPNLNPNVCCGLYCKGAGVCSAYELAIALAENAIANGTELFLNSPVNAIDKAENIFTVSAGNNNLQAKYVVNAAGLNAANVAGFVQEANFSIHPRSGEYLLLNKDSGAVAQQVLFQMPTKKGKGILVTPTIYGNLLLGPDAIDEEKSDRNTHVERLYDIYTSALQTTTKIDLNRFLRSFAGVRAVSSTDDFIIEESETKGFIHVAGIQSPGLTSSPAIAQMVADILKTSGLKLTLNASFNPNRKATYTPHQNMPPKKLQVLLDKPEGEAGRMVCRCEQVEESALANAMNRGIPLSTVDALKRRTRAGMGFCQGEFCRPRTAALMTSLTGKTISPDSDAMKDGLKRVTRNEMLGYIKQKI